MTVLQNSPAECVILYQYIERNTERCTFLCCQLEEASEQTVQWLVWWNASVRVHVTQRYD